MTSLHGDLATKINLPDFAAERDCLKQERQCLEVSLASWRWNLGNSTTPPWLFVSVAEIYRCNGLGSKTKRFSSCIKLTRLSR